ncbi:oxidoreductase [Colletotrichum nymphaeae SA-01]|uniref:Oxidoreductase n=1 Tax=Colletotrichum nymphaeae SA-01 TaxID=1460502 RepID=A0A135UDZ6_9PEZI|nr:oxidoreductase [Colletotrichum nymphaeae SA-01]
MADRYVAIHADPKGPGDARPTAEQIVRDENLVPSGLASKTALITGCSAGIGTETAKALYLAGATLYLTARNLAKARKALGDDLVNDAARVHLLELDLESLASVRACAAAFLASTDKLDILICNAGVMTPPEGRTRDGFETQFGTNHLAHFLLFNLLQPALLKAATTSPSGTSSRVVIVSSVAHRFGQPNFANINFDGCYDPMATYAQSKTANLWTANEIERRYGAQGIHALSLQPGGVITELMRHMPEEQQGGFAKHPYLSKIFKTAPQGASTSVWAATAAALEGKGGLYLEDCQIIGPWDPAGEPWGPGYGEHAYDVEKATLLWEKSLEWVGL